MANPTAARWERHTGRSSSRSRGSDRQKSGNMQASPYSYFALTRGPRRLFWSAKEAYDAGMTKLLQDLIERARRLPDERQDYLAQALLGLIDDGIEPEVTNPDHVVAIREGLAQVRRGEFAGDEEVEAAFRRFDT